MTKRLLFIQTQAENAGAQEISRLLGSKLEARGYDVHHLFFYRKSDTYIAPQNTRFVCVERPGTPFAILHFLFKLIKEIRHIKPDVVFSFQHFGNALGAPAARLAGVKHVIANQVTARELIHPALVHMDKLWGSCGVYDQVTVNSKSLHNDYCNHPARYTQNLVRIPHGFDDKTTSCDKQSAREQLGLPLDATLIGCASRLNPAKQIDKAIAMLQKNPDWHFAIAGQGPDQDRLLRVAKALNVTERVHFLGEIAPDSIGFFLASLDVFVFPSAAETFGLSAVEAAQAGIPVVANDLPVLREVLANNGQPCATFVDVTDTGAFSAEVQRMLDDDDFANQIIQRGLRLKDKYGLSRMVDAYETLILDTNPSFSNETSVAVK